MTRYILAPAARLDLAEIWDYTAERWGSAQAERYTIAVRDACDDLASGEKRGRPIDDIRPGYSKLAVGSHFLFFRRTDDGSVEIVPILHKRMDVETRL